jgi:hypothetical protein
MASPDTWLGALATVKAAFESFKSGVDFLDALKKYRQDRDTIAESRRVSVVFSSYSEEEIASIEKRIQECQKRFIAEGDGKKRNSCICSVLKDVADGNGGVIPLIDDWQNISRQMCGSR